MSGHNWCTRQARRSHCLDTSRDWIEVAAAAFIHDCLFTFVSSNDRVLLAALQRLRQHHPKV